MEKFEITYIEDSESITEHFMGDWASAARRASLLELEVGDESGENLIVTHIQKLVILD